MTTSIPSAARHAGHTSNAIFVVTQKDSRCRKTLANKAFRSPAGCSRYGAHSGSTKDRERLAAEMAPIQAKLRELLQNAARKSKRTRLHRRFANNLLKIWPALWTFLSTENVQPTNNAAERSLRGPVIHRKLTHGTRTEDRERFIERALSASVTCRLQHRSLFDYMTKLLHAHARNDPLPTLT